MLSTSPNDDDNDLFDLPSPRYVSLFSSPEHSPASVAQTSEAGQGDSSISRRILSADPVFRFSILNKSLKIVESLTGD